MAVAKNEEKVVETTLRIQEKSFDQRGEKINYLECVARVYGVEIRFEAGEKDMKLFKYLLEQNGIISPKNNGDKEGVK